MDTIDLKELKEFLGNDFRYGIDSSWELANDWNSQDRLSYDSIIEFYRDTPWYVYNLTVWSASGQRPQYINIATEALKRYSINSIIDFGAGVGTDALSFASLGYKVGTYEINSQCNRFLEWRKNRRNLGIDIHSELSTIPISFDLLWAVDVVEHLKDPVTTLSPFLERCKFFIYDTEFSGKSEGRHPFHFEHDIDALRKAWRELGFVQSKDYNSDKPNIFIKY